MSHDPSILLPAFRYTLLALMLAAASVQHALGQSNLLRYAPQSQPAAIHQSSQPVRLPETLPSPSPAGTPSQDRSMQQLQSPELVAQPAGMCLEDFYNLALTHQPTLVKAQAAVESARGQWLQVGLYPNPDVAYLATQMNDGGTAGQQGGYVEQEFVRGRKLTLNRAVAAREIEIAQQQFEAQRYRVLNDVRIHFYDALVAQEMLNLADNLLNVAGQAEKAVDDLFQAQESSRVELLQAKVEADTARMGRVNAANRQRAAWQRLVAVAGVPGLPVTTVSGDLLGDMPSFTWESALDRILAESPELAASRIGIDRAMWALRRARAEPIPNVIMQAGPQYDNNQNRTIVNANVLMSLPLFDYNQGNVRKAEADVRSARAELNRKELELTTKLASAYERYANARNQVDVYRTDILPNAQEALKLVADGYRQGELNYLLLLTSQRSYFANNLAYLEAVREMWEASIRIDGLLLDDSLQSLGGETESTSPRNAQLPVLPFNGQ